MAVKKTSVQETLKFPGFTYMGFDIPGLEIPTSLIDDLGPGEPAYKLVPKSIPLAWRVGLYLVGRDLSLGIEDAEYLPEPVKKAGKLVYQDTQKRKGRGGWHKDGVLFLPKSETPKGMWQMKDPYVLAKHFKDIEGFEEKDGEWKIKSLPDTREEYVWLPEGDGNFVVPPTKHEITPYHPITGTPFETIENREKAIKRWTDAGLTEEQAKKEVSRFYRRNSAGLAAVFSWSFGSDGPLGVLLDSGPRSWDPDVGSFPASRSAERSEAPKNSGFRLITKEKYDFFEAERKKLEAVREAANK